jgi:hypothetical protein
MQNVFTPEFFAQSGVFGLFLFLTVRAIMKLYSDMRKDAERIEKNSKEREERLMNYLDKKSETDLKVSETLDNINHRITSLEEAIEDCKGTK